MKVLHHSTFLYASLPLLAACSTVRNVGSLSFSLTDADVDRAIRYDADDPVNAIGESCAYWHGLARTHADARDRDGLGRCLRRSSHCIDESGQADALTRYVVARADKACAPVGEQERRVAAPAAPPASAGEGAPERAGAYKEDPAQLARACDAGTAESCFGLGVSFEQGRGVDKDKTRAAVLYTRACDGGDVRGCVNVYTDACDGGHLEGCFRLGLLFDDGRGVPQDRARAEDLYAKACKGGEASGCTLQELKKHYATMLSGLAMKHLIGCREPAPADAVRTTTNNIRTYAEVPAPASDLNVHYEPWEMISSLFTHLARATGASRFDHARQILAAPATLVVDVESEVPPTQTSKQMIVSGNASGVFTPGSLVVRQVRFDPNGKAVCATRVTLKNSNVTVKSGSSWVESAREQLRANIASSF
jgi:TPR repeat protein